MTVYTRNHAFRAESIAIKSNLNKIKLCERLHIRFKNGGTNHETNKPPSDAHAQARKIRRVRSLRSPVCLRQHELLLHGLSAPCTRRVGAVQ